MMNRYRGEHGLNLGGEQRTLRFSWDAIARLRCTYGNDFDRQIVEAIDHKDVAVLAEVIGVATGLEPVEVMAASPPLVVAGNAIVEALKYAYHGMEGKPENPRPARQLATWWKQLMRRLFGQGLTRKHSGD